MHPSVAPPISAANPPPNSTETLHDAFPATTLMKREASLDISRIETLYSVGSAEDEKQEPANHQLSTLRLLIAHVGAALTLFLATTDSNIVSTSLPTISRELNASQTQYTWVGVAYLLTQTAFQPLYGRFSDLVGRKVLLFSSITVFALGSLLCGASKSITMLIASRALAGVGGGGIVSSVWVITSEIVPVQSRANWSQALSVTWSCSAIAGPLLGGVFSGNEDSGLSWRWGFYINLPICFLASVVLSFSLRGVSLQRSTRASWRTILERFDFGGLFLFMAGTTSIIFGFSFANENGWKSATTITSLSLGSVTLISAGLYESWTKRDCLFPPSAFTDSTAVIVLVIVFFHNFAFNAAMFYLALFFQTVKGYTPLEAGIQLLPFSLGSSIASIPAAWFIGYWQRRKNDSSGQNMIISTGLLMSTIGFGLFALLDAAASRAEQVLFILIAGVGMGFLFHAPYQVFVRTLRPHELATGTSAFFLVRFTGATIGLAVAGAILYARASKLLPFDLGVDITAKVLEDITLIEPLEARQKALEALSTSIQTIWIVCAPSLGLSFLISLLTKKLPFDTDVKEGALEKIETDSRSTTV